MLNSLGKDFTAYLESERSTGKNLALIATVQDGDQKLRTEMLPGLTVDWDDDLSFQKTGNAIGLSPRFAVTLYTASLEGVDVADTAHKKLMCEAHGGGFRGVIPALLKLQGVFIQDSGQSWNMDFRPLPRINIRDGRHATTIQTVEIDFAALFNQSQFT